MKIPFRKIAFAFLTSAALACAIIGCTSTSTVTTSTVVTTNSDGSKVTNNVTTTNVTKTFDIALATNTINALVPLGVSYAVNADPASKPYIQDAVTGLNAIVLGGTNVTPAQLAVALKTTTITNQQALLAIQSVISLYTASYAEIVEQKLNTVQYLIPILQSLAGAVQQGLGAPPTAQYIIKDTPDSYLDNALVSKVKTRDGTNFIGVYLGMIAEHDGKGGVYMASATSGEVLRWIGYDEFKAVYVDKSKPEYPVYKVN